MFLFQKILEDLIKIIEFKHLKFLINCFINLICLNANFLKILIFIFHFSVSNSGKLMYLFDLERFSTFLLQKIFHLQLIIN